MAVQSFCGFFLLPRSLLKFSSFIYFYGFIIIVLSILNVHKNRRNKVGEFWLHFFKELLQLLLPLIFISLLSTSENKKEAKKKKKYLKHPKRSIKPNRFKWEEQVIHTYTKTFNLQGQSLNFFFLSVCNLIMLAHFASEVR